MQPGQRPRQLDPRQSIDKDKIIGQMAFQRNKAPPPAKPSKPPQVAARPAVTGQKKKNKKSKKPPAALLAMLQARNYPSSS